MIGGRKDLRILILEAVASSKGYPTYEEIIAYVVQFYPKLAELTIAEVKSKVLQLINLGELKANHKSKASDPTTMYITGTGRAALVDSFELRAHALTRLESMPDVAKLLISVGSAWDMFLVVLLGLYERKDFVTLTALVQLTQKRSEKSQHAHNPEQVRELLGQLNNMGMVEEDRKSYKLTFRGDLLVESLSILQHSCNDIAQARRKTLLASS